MADADSSEKTQPPPEPPLRETPLDPSSMDRALYRGWAIALIFSLTFSLGVSPALRGTTVGLEVWIDRSDRLSSFVGQAAALIGSVLSMRFLIAELPRKRPWLITLLVGLLSTVPLVALLSATRGTLGERVSVLNAAVVAVIGILVMSAHITVRSRHALLPALAALAIGGRASLAIEYRPDWVGVAAWISLAACLLASLVAIGFQRVKTPAIALSTTLISTEFIFRILRGSVDPLFTSLLSGTPSLVVPIWLLMPVCVIAHFRGASLRNLGAPLLVLASISPLTPLSLLAATNGLLCLLPEMISKGAQKSAASAPLQ